MDHDSDGAGAPDSPADGFSGGRSGGGASSSPAQTLSRASSAEDVRGVGASSRSATRRQRYGLVR
jgi:hypothetical protein